MAQHKGGRSNQMSEPAMHRLIELNDHEMVSISRISRVVRDREFTIVTVDQVEYWLEDPNRRIWEILRREAIVPA